MILWMSLVDVVVETYDGPAWRLISTLCGESATRNLANRKARIGCHDEGVVTCVALTP